DTFPAVLLLNDNTASEVENIGGQLGIALEPTESTTIGTLRAFNGETQLGNVNATGVYDYNNTVRRSGETATGSTLQIRTF
ncbi:MAG: hypothetical protein KDA71_09775, partial [Planctomycetales bacterium]|nr:hypothetical protein [Planctomycetales bacterium]